MGCGELRWRSPAASQSFLNGGWIDDTTPACGWRFADVSGDRFALIRKGTRLFANHVLEGRDCGTKEQLSQVY
jgi:hypothetical protein